MCQTVEDQIEHVLVGQEIEDVFSFTATPYDTVGPQDPQPLRDDRHRFTLKFGQFRDASFALRKARYQANSRRLPKRTKNSGRALNRWFTDGKAETPGMMRFRRTSRFTVGPHQDNIEYTCTFVQVYLWKYFRPHLWGGMVSAARNPP
jgi:hypothetical protein